MVVAFLYWIFIFILSMFILIYSAELFIERSKELGKTLGLSDFLIGLLIVSVGTTLPELASSIYATIKGTSEIVIPTVLGSVTTNVFLVIGLVGFLYGTKYLSKKQIKTDLWVFALISCLFVLFIIDNHFSIFEAILCILIFIFYSIYEFKLSKVADSEKTEVKSKSYMNIFLLLIYSFLIYIGSKYAVDSILEVSSIVGIFPEIIALTVIALGTSLSELTVGIISLRKGHLDIAVANIIGASIIDLLIVTSVSRFFGFVVVPFNIFKFAIPVFGLAVISFIYVVLDKKLTKTEGILLLVMYVFFIILSFLI